jgi:hypothetical protein
LNGKGNSLLFAALVAYLALAFSSAGAVGAVGEVRASWALPTPPTVLVQWSPPVESNAGGTLGPFEARQTRPTESLRLGDLRLPLAVNAYTGGAPDWPARAARALTGSRAAGAATTVLLGGLLLTLAHRFLRFHGTPAAAAAAAALLATDWVFVFFKRVLGGTELLLQTAGLLVLWSLWSRRWKGGRHGTLALALGVGLGLGAKVTFVGTLVAVAAAAALTRWDRPAMKPPERVRLAWLVGLPLLAVSPLVWSAVHHALLPEGPRVVSHDTLGLQVGRLLDGATMGREAFVNLGRFFGNPTAWMADAWGTRPVSGFSALRVLALAVAVAGTALEWKNRTRSPSAALLRFLSLLVPLQVGALFALNHDLHHLAQATVPLALWTALGAERVAAELSRARSPLRTAATLLFVFPSLLAGVQQLRQTDALVRTATSRTFTADGQLALAEMLREAGVKRVVVTDYELCGVLEEVVPDVEVVHGWGAVSRGERDVAALRATVGDDHYLRVRASAPLVYNWRADDVGVRVAALSDGRSNWAELYRVE